MQKDFLTNHRHLTRRSFFNRVGAGVQGVDEVMAYTPQNGKVEQRASHSFEHEKSPCRRTFVGEELPGDPRGDRDVQLSPPLTRRVVVFYYG